ncbi:lipase 3-like, partial [Pieris napi]|uniref:lipase 3-like n=1 Tax=Pieris napi TaxID=78633 RepID=UPI001FB8E350
MFRLLLIVGLFISTSAGRSPHAEYVTRLNQESAFGPTLSDNLLLDAILDVPDMIRRYNYPMEEHFVITPDGYILGVQRIPHGRDRNNIPGDRPVVFVMHGLLSSSADYLISGPGDALAYILAEEGYDVWLGNARGNYYSRKHLTLNPEGEDTLSFWDFSWDEIGNIDLPTMIDYVLAQTGKSALHYIGMSQGTTSFFVMGSLRPDYNKKIISMHALAPVAYLGHTKHSLLRHIARYSANLAALARLIGLGEFLPNRAIWTWVGQNMCKDKAPLQVVCKNIFFFIGGHNEDQFNATLLPVKFGHFPAGASVRQLSHYGQSISTSMFRRYDHGWAQNLLRYGSPEPPRYNLSNIVCPVYLHYSESDPLADVIDVNKLFNELGGTPIRIRVPDKKFSHIDFVWGIDAKTLVYDNVIEIMKNFDKTGKETKDFR